MPAFLSDWTFWSFVAAAVAIALSQLSPVRLWFRKPSLDAEVHATISVSHRVGNPNLQLHVIVINNGGKPIRVRGMSISVSRNGEKHGTYPAQNYLQKSSDTVSVLFTPFTLMPDDEWSHIMNFLKFFSREDENLYRQLESQLRSDVNEKLAIRRMVEDNPTGLVEADEENVAPLLEFFEERFNWTAGEYEMTLIIEGDKTKCAKRFTFAIFESESAELRSIADHYKYGAGILWERTDVKTGLLVPLHESADD